MRYFGDIKLGSVSLSKIVCGAYAFVALGLLVGCDDDPQPTPENEAWTTKIIKKVTGKKKK